MNWLIAFDAWLILKWFEPYAWKSEYNGSLDCFGLSRATTFLGFMILNVGWWMFEPVFVVMLGPITGMMWVSHFLASIFVEHMVVTRPSHINPMKRNWFNRLLVLCVGIYMLYTHAQFANLWAIGGDLIGMPLVVAGMYFLSCNPMPPGWSPPVRTPKAASLPAQA